jgi:hypothetical protein
VRPVPAAGHPSRSKPQSLACAEQLAAARPSRCSAPAWCLLQDWWWKARLGQCYARLGLLRDAEHQLASSLKCGGSVGVALALGALYLRMDQPTAALALYQVG